MKQLTDEDVRAVGGIVHRDGNVFFTNVARLNKAVELAAQPVQVNEWRAAVTDALVVAHILTTENAIYPRKAVQDVIDWNCQVALDPRVSSKAQALVDSGKSVQVNAVLVEDVNSEIVKRYKVEKTKGGFWPYCVRAGDGTMGLFIGSKKQADHVQQALQSACLDGAFMAFAAAKQAQPVCGYDDETGNCTRVNCCKQAQPERVTTAMVEGLQNAADKLEVIQARGIERDKCIAAFEQAQPERAGLTEAEVTDIAIKWSNSRFVAMSDRFVQDFAREILAAEKARRPA